MKIYYLGRVAFWFSWSVCNTFCSLKYHAFISVFGFYFEIQIER